MTNRHEIHLIPAADGEAVMAYVPALKLMAECDTEEQALADIKEAIERYHAESRNATPPYTHEDYFRDELQCRLRREERQIIKDFAGGEIPQADARMLSLALLRLMGKRPDGDVFTPPRREHPSA